MLNEEKIKLMTRLAAYEQKNGKRDIRLSKYYRSDYVRFQMLNTILCGTIAFVILVVMYILYHTEYLIDNALVRRLKKGDRPVETAEYVDLESIDPVTREPIKKLPEEAE